MYTCTDDTMYTVHSKQDLKYKQMTQLESTITILRLIFVLISFECDCDRDLRWTMAPVINFFTNNRGGKILKTEDNHLFSKTNSVQTTVIYVNSLQFAYCSCGIL